MPTTHPREDLVITFKPEATEEEKERFLAELARAFIAIARYLVDRGVTNDADDLETIEF